MSPQLIHRESSPHARGDIQFALPLFSSINPLNSPSQIASGPSREPETLISTRNAKEKAQYRTQILCLLGSPESGKLGLTQVHAKSFRGTMAFRSPVGSCKGVQPDAIPCPNKWEVEAEKPRRKRKGSRVQANCSGTYLVA